MATKEGKLTMSAIQWKTGRHGEKKTKQENITKTEKKYQPFKTDPEVREMPDRRYGIKVFCMFKVLTKDIEDFF